MNQKTTINIRGYYFAFMATAMGSLVYIFSKAALKEVSLPQFGVYWFLMGMIWNSLYAMRKKENRAKPVIPQAALKVLIVLGFIEIVATSTLYGAIYVAYDPSVPSFLRNLEFIFVGLLGVVLLKERFNYIEIAGVVLTIGGAMIISYQKGLTFKTYFTGTSGLMLISSISYAIRTIIAKKHITVLSPTMLAINRAVFIFFFSFIALILMGYSLVIPLSAFFNIALGAFFGPFLTSTSQYSALKYLEASRAAVIQSATPLLVLVVGYFYLGTLPFMYQLIGGIFTIIGTIILVVGNEIRKALHLSP